MIAYSLHSHIWNLWKLHFSDNIFENFYIVHDTMYDGMTGGEEDNIIFCMDSCYTNNYNIAETLTRGRKRIFLVTVRWVLHWYGIIITLILLQVVDVLIVKE